MFFYQASDNQLEPYTDDSHAESNGRAQEVMNEWIAFIEQFLREGMASGEFRQDLNVSETAVFLSSAFEGSIMIGKLYNDNSYFFMGLLTKNSRRRKHHDFSYDTLFG